MAGMHIKPTLRFGTRLRSSLSISCHKTKSPGNEPGASSACVDTPKGKESVRQFVCYTQNCGRAFAPHFADRYSIRQSMQNRADI